MSRKQYCRIVAGLVLLFAVPRAASPQTREAPTRRGAQVHTSARRRQSLAARAIHYVGGAKPHIVVIPSEVLPYLWQESHPNGYHGTVTRRTPLGRIQVHWNMSQGTEDGSVIPHPDEIHQYATITQFAVISPAKVPITLYVEVASKERTFQEWIRINGMKLDYFRPVGTDKRRPNFRLVKLGGGLNIIQAGLYDAE